MRPTFVLSVAASTAIACSGAARPAPAAPCPATPVSTEADAPAPAADAPAAPIASCDTAERHQLDFWVGRWDVVIQARAKPGDPMATARGTNHVTKILGGCVVSEHFEADGPGPPWAGRSYSQWFAPAKQWKQTWVDDQGGYIPLEGGVEHGDMTLYAPPRTKDGVTSQMRMVFSDVQPDHFKWRWERTTDGGTTWAPQMLIDYTRAK
jgi:Protein of unknown function (DUF1579)